MISRRPTRQDGIALLTWPLKKWRIIAAALTCIGILHIGTTLAVSNIVRSTAIDRLKTDLPVNQMRYLPAITPDNQKLPFMGSDTLYAMCRFDSSATPVQLSAYLPGSGWSLAIHAHNGVSLYTAAGQEDLPIRLNLKLVPSTTRFSGLTPEALGVISRQVKQQIVESRNGIAIIRAPDRGHAYRQKTEIDIEKSTCYPIER
ncbi:MAG: hypothetical protein AAFV45_06360 [Pseudomonadota bacterium]